MKRFPILLTLCAGVLLGTAAFFSSCEKDSKKEFAGKNELTFSITESNPSLKSDDLQGKITVTVKSTVKLAEELPLNVVITPKDNAPAGLKVQAPVKFAKDATEVTFDVVRDSKVAYTQTDQEQKFTYTLSLKDLPKNTTLKAPIDVQVVVAAKKVLTKEEQLLEAWKTNLGIDMTPFIGDIAYTTKVTYTEEEGWWAATEQGGPVQTFKGTTKISISPNATEDKILINMERDAMGMARPYRMMLDGRLFHSGDLGDPDIWNDPKNAQNGSPIFKKMSETLNWNSASQETFDVRIEELEVTKDGTIKFVREVTYLAGTPVERKIQAVPFIFEYSAEQRLRKDHPDLLKESGHEEGSPVASLYINVSGIDTDEWEEALHVTPTGSIANGKMTFLFNTDTSQSSDYSKIEVEYTGNK